MSVYDIKPGFQALLRPAMRRLAAWGVTANQVTVAAALLSIATGITLYVLRDKRWPLLLVPVVLFIRMALNAIDGMLAREFGQKSRLGAVLNELGDVVSDATIYLPFAMVPGVRAELVVIVVLLAAIGEMAGVVAVQVGASRRYDGPMGKSDRALAFGAVALLLGLGVEPGRWVNPVLGLVLAGLVLTIFNRVRSALREPSHVSPGL